MDFTGTSGADTLTGTKGDDTISGLQGNDTINATQGNDTIDGGIGNDRLQIATGNLARFDAYAGPRTYLITNTSATDSAGLLNSSLVSIERMTITTLGTGDYNDTIDASGFNSLATLSMLITTGGGNDTIIGTGQADSISAGTGSNWIDAGGGIDSVVVAYHNELGGTLTISGDNALLTTDFNGSEVSTVRNAESIRIDGFTSGAGMVIDASGADGFAGQIGYALADGVNVVIGRNGFDFFSNSSGWLGSVDTMTGNGGADIFDYTFAVGAMNGDTITDLDGDDIIDLQFNTPALNGGFLANQFIGNAAFSGVAGQYRFDVDVDQGFTYLQVDTDGDGAADETLTITNGNFALAETSAGSNQLVLGGISGGAGDDFLEGTKGDENIFGQGGDDTIAATQGIDRTDGGDGTDQLRFILSNANRFDAATGSRTFVVDSTTVTDSTGLINTTFSYFESLFINALGTGDYGDVFDGSTAAQRLIIRAGHGDDTLLGGSGNDDLATGLGINTVDAGGGYDLVRAQFDNSGGATAYVTMQGGAVVTTLDNVVVNSVINAEQVGIIGFDFNAGATVDASGLVGYDGMVVFWDNNGSNNSIGHDGTDVFANIFEGVTGTDVYTGNGGADIYDYTFAVAAMDGDTITDFDADDIIDLQFNNAVQNGGGFVADQFIGTAAFSGVAGQYRYEASGGQTFVQVDTDGDGTADETLTIANGQFALAETSPGSNLLKIIGLSGTSGIDTMTGTQGNDRLYGQAGNDIFNGSQGNDYIDGGAGGGDRLHFLTGNAALFAAATGGRTYTIGATSITDSSGTLNTSFTGVERINLSTVGNGDFDDVIDASGYNSPHSAGLDVRLGNGDNMVTGSAGNDRIFGGLGSNILNGGPGGYDQIITSFDSTTTVTVTITSVGGSVVASGGGKTDTVSNAEEVWVQGVGPGAITLDASGYVHIPGLTMVLIGHNGTDIMIGHAGSDYFGNITGQVLGSDVYTGNGGADIYDYTFAADSMNGDTITDFDIDDVIDMRFNNLELGGSPVLANHFIDDAAFSGTAGEYRYQVDGTTTHVQVDSNGDGVADQVLTIANGGFALAETAPGSNLLTLAAVINPLEGVVADGYVAGATLFVDVDGDGVRDAGEAWTTTDADGDFALNVNQAGTIVATGGTNIDTGLANRMDLKAPYSASVVNPLTTLVAAIMAGSPLSAAQAETAVKDALGLDASLDLLSTDLLAQGNDAAALAAQKAAALIVNLVTTAEAVAGADGSTEQSALDALAGLVGSGAPVDLTDAGTLQSLLEEALPSSGNLAGVAGQLAAEGDAIAAADSLAAISAAQLAAALTGDDQANALTGTDAANTLSGNGGNDTLLGMGGNDTLDGGTGADRMEGGLGDDLYIVDQSGDQVIELTDQGIDTVRSGVNWTLGANVENLELTGSAISGTGNALANSIIGTAGANILSGGGGNDSLLGGAGNDRLNGEAGNDLLRGGDGTDVLSGGGGNDRFVVDTGTPIMSKLGPLSLDLVTDFQPGDKIDLSFLDANSLFAGDQDFAFKGSSPSKDAGTVWFKTYDSMQGAEKALGADIDGVAGKSPYSGPVTILFGNQNGGDPDFAMALVNVGTLQASDLIMG